MVVRVNDLREKGYHLQNQGPRSSKPQSGSQAAKFLSGRKLKKLGVSKVDQHLR